MPQSDENMHTLMDCLNKKDVDGAGRDSVMAPAVALKNDPIAACRDSDMKILMDYLNKKLSTVTPLMTEGYDRQKEATDAVIAEEERAKGSNRIVLERENMMAGEAERDVALEERCRAIYRDSDMRPLMDYLNKKLAHVNDRQKEATDTLIAEKERAKSSKETALERENMMAGSISMRAPQEEVRHGNAASTESLLSSWTGQWLLAMRIEKDSVPSLVQELKRHGCADRLALAALSDENAEVLADTLQLGLRKSRFLYHVKKLKLTSAPGSP